MHHVTTRSIAEEHIFRDSGDYAACITIFASLVDEGFFVCHAFCIMPTHYHLYCTFANVSTAIHKLNRRYAKKFNKRYGRRGHVFDSPFSRTEVTTESHYLELPRYIALNPRDYETWPYSSYPGLIGKREPFSFVDPSPIIDALEASSRSGPTSTRAGRLKTRTWFRLRRQPGSMKPRAYRVRPAASRGRCRRSHPGSRGGYG